MNQTPEPNQPIAVPVLGELVTPPPKVDAAQLTPLDPVIELQQLRDQQQRWKGHFIAACIAFVFLLVVSVLQFIGTFITCQILFAARQDSERAQKETTQLMKDLGDARSSLDQAAKNLGDARQLYVQYVEIQTTLKSLEAQAARLVSIGHADARRLELLTQVEALREDAERLLREPVELMKSRLREADGLLDQMYGMKEQQQSQVLPVVDPNHKHPTACPVDQWPGVRGLSNMREPTAGQREEEEHQLAVLIGPPADDTATVGDEPDFFTKHVLPIFHAKCAACHIASKKGKLSLKSIADILKGGQSGPAVVRGDLKKSVMWEEISDKSMPPKGQPQLTAAEIEIIRHWIATKE